MKISFKTRQSEEHTLTLSFPILSQVDLRHKDEDRDVVKVNTKTEEVGPPPVIDVGIDLSEFYMSVEWDILQVHYC